MNLETRIDGQFTYLKPLSNSIDATVSNDFKERVMDLIMQGNNFFILNMSKVDFIDSSGLGAMISILKKLTLNNGDIVLCELNSAVTNLLKLTRMNTVFKVCLNEKECLEALNETKNKVYL